MAPAMLRRFYEVDGFDHFVHGDRRKPPSPYNEIAASQPARSSEASGLARIPRKNDTPSKSAASGPVSRPVPVQHSVMQALF